MLAEAKAAASRPQSKGFAIQANTISETGGGWLRRLCLKGSLHQGITLDGFSRRVLQKLCPRSGGLRYGIGRPCAQKNLVNKSMEKTVGRPTATNPVRTS
jgi:hypothetical protein